MDLELDDVGPSVGRGPILVACRDDESGAIAVRSLTDSWLPVELVEAFVAEAKHRLPPTP